MISQVIQTHFINLLEHNFETAEIDAIGKQLEPKFDSHFLSGQPFGITLRSDVSSRVIVEHFVKKGILNDLIVLVFNLYHSKDTVLLRREFKLDGADAFLQKLASAGYRFNAVSGALEIIEKEEEIDLWGYLKEGESYNFSYLSIDIVGNSGIQLKYPNTDIQIVYNGFYQMLNQIVKKYKGKVWNWAGDGGIVAFYLDDKLSDAVFCAIEIQLQMHLFNLNKNLNRFDEPIRLRIAAHEGLTHYKENKGTILSDAINYVAHLEKGGTTPGSVSVSENIFRHLSDRLKAAFTDKGKFEDINYYNFNLNLSTIKT
jgi:class 3 adenylate cyclase